MWKEAWLGACRKRSGIDVISRMRRMIRNTDTSAILPRSALVRFWAAFIQSTGEVCPKAVCLIVHSPGVEDSGDSGHPKPTRLFRISYADRKSQNRTKFKLLGHLY